MGGSRGRAVASCPSSPSHLHLSPPPASPPSLPLQVRSSLGTNILSTMAAFAGTAILLMDFGVTNWVCCPTSPGVGKLEEEQQPIQEAARVGGREVVGPWASAEPANSKRPPGVYGPQDPTSRVGIVWGRGRVAEKQS